MGGESVSVPDSPGRRADAQKPAITRLDPSKLPAIRFRLGGEITLQLFYALPSCSHILFRPLSRRSMSTSPFEIFRRNLKPLMVFLTLLALLSFVVLPVVQSSMQARQGMGSGNTVVAKFAGAELTRSRVDYFTRNHQSTVRFLVDLAEETIAKGGVPRTAGFQYNAQQKQVQSLGINENPSTEGTIRTFMFSGQASEEGFALDDSSISRWLERFTDGMFSEGEITSKLMQATRNEMGRPHLYEQLRNHLLADVYLRRGNVALVSSTGALLTPDEQWRNFLKMNQSATTDVYGVLVNDYIEKTNTSPSESKIREVFEDGKERDPTEQSPEPAFHRPYQASYEYLVGDYQEFLTAAVADVTEEEIKAEYERRLKGGDFKLPDEPLDDANEELSLDADESDATESDASEMAAEENKSEESSKEEAELTEEPATEDQSGLKSRDAIRLVMFQDEGTAVEKPAAEKVEAAAEEDKEAAEETTEAPAEEDADMKEEAATEAESAAEEPANEPMEAEAKPETSTAEATDAEPADMKQAEATEEEPQEPRNPKSSRSTKSAKRSPKTWLVPLLAKQWTKR